MVTSQQLASFVSFAREQITIGRAISMGQLLEEWETQQEQQASIHSLRNSIAEADSDLAMPIKEAFDEIQRRTGLSSEA